MGLTENSTALLRWMVCDPVMARLLQKFERATEKSESIDRRHHEQKSHVQIAFQKRCAITDPCHRRDGKPIH